MDQINFRKDVSTVQGSCEILNVWDWVLVGDSSIVQCTIIAAGAPITIFSGTMWSGEDQLLEGGDNFKLQHVLKLLTSVC